MLGPIALVTSGRFVCSRVPPPAPSCPPGGGVCLARLADSFPGMVRCPGPDVPARLLCGSESEAPVRSPPSADVGFRLVVARQKWFRSGKKCEIRSSAGDEGIGEGTKHAQAAYGDCRT